ncbi:MAG: efflux RND transporter periplasmic adaptor subunit [Armatimonadota bacterium]|nr:efflux RND transporter periplasmic adaptor subunit [Armatimonadota bacterium]
MRQRRKWLVGIGIAAILAVIVGVRLALPAPRVEVVRPASRDVVEVVVATGRVRALVQSEVGSETGGVVSEVLVREGDVVQPGQLVARLRREELLEQWNAARAAVETAQRELQQVSRGSLPEEVARARAELEQAEQVGRARLEAALQRLKQLESGGRAEEVARAQAVLVEAESRRKQAEADLRRTRQLYEAGALSRADLEKAETALEAARAAEENARAQVALARQPARPEEIEAARAEVQSARASYEQSVRAARANLQLLLRQPLREEVEVARARLRQAEANRRLVEERLRQRDVFAPIGGIVVRRNVEPGQSVLPGQSLLSLADLRRVEIIMETDEANLPALAAGQSATVVAPAYRNQPFRAIVTQVGPEIDTQRGVVTVRLKPVQIPPFLRPDMTVDVSVEVKRLQGALTVPVSAVVARSGEAVFVVEGGVVRLKPVQVLVRGEEAIAVEGLSPQDLVVKQALRVREGQKATPQLSSGG